MTRSRIIAGKAVILIEAQDLVDKTLKRTQANLNKFANGIGNLGENLFRTGFFGAIGSGVLVSGFVKFDDAMRTLRVNLDLFGKTAKQVESVMKPLEDRIRSLAKTTPFSPTQVAGAATSLAKGGFSPTQIVDSLQAVLDLARATNTELEFTADFIVRTLTTYNISTAKASEVASQLVNATRKGTLGIEDLEAAMRYSSGTADTLGVSLQKMLAIFTVLSNRGLVGSIAGTSTNTAFSQLVKKAEDLAALGKIELVTGIREDGKEAIDVIKSLQNLFRYADTLPFTKQQTLFQDVFNLRGARSVSALRNAIENVNELTKSISESGDEARQASTIIDEGLGGALRRLLSTAQNLSTTLSKRTQATLIGISNAVKALVESLTRLSIASPDLTTLVILSPGILLGAGVGFIALAKSLRLAAAATGALLTVYRPLARLITSGTGAQIAFLSQTFKSNKIPSTAFKPVKLPKSSPAAGLTYGGPPPGTSNTASRILAAEAKLQETINKNIAQEAEARTKAAATITAARQNKLRGVELEVQAERVLAKAEQDRTAQLANYTKQQQNATKAVTVQKAVLDQNTRSIAANVKSRKDNLTALRQTESFQKSINSLNQEAYEIDQKLAKTRISQDPKGGLREIPNLPTAELKRLTADRERIAFQIFRLQQEQQKLNARPDSDFSSRQRQLNLERVTALRKLEQAEKVAINLRKDRIQIEDEYIKKITRGQDLLLEANRNKTAATVGAQSFLETRGQAAAATSRQKRVIQTQADELAALTAKARQEAAEKFATKRPTVKANFLEFGGGVLRGFRTTSVGLFNFGKSLLHVLNIVRRFTFTFGGFFTILEGIILFGDRIPGVATVLERFGLAFTNAFRAVGNIAKFAAGPIALLRASLAAFTQDRGDLGIKGLVNGMKLLAAIVKNQLYVAWLRFKQSLGTVYGILAQIATGIGAVFNGVITAVGSAISTMVGTLGQQFGSIVRLFGLDGKGLTFDQGAGGLGNFIRELSILLSNLPLLLADVFERLISKFDTFILDFETMLRNILAPWVGRDNRDRLLNPNAVNQLTPGKQDLLAKQLQQLNEDPRTKADREAGRFKRAFQEGLDAGIISKEFSSLKDQYLPASEALKIQREIVRDVRLGEIETQRKANTERINKAFSNLSLPNIGKDISSALARSQALATQGFIGAQRIAAELGKKVIEAAKAPSNFDQTITPARQIQQAKQIGLTIGASLVGSAQSTRGNLIRFNKVEEEQLKTLKSIDANIQKGLRNDGAILSFTK